MMLLPSSPGRQAEGLRHSSRGQHVRVRLRNVTALEPSRPVRAFQPFRSPRSQRTPSFRLYPTTPRRLCAFALKSKNCQTNPFSRESAVQPLPFKPSQGFFGEKRLFIIRLEPWRFEIRVIGGSTPYWPKPSKTKPIQAYAR